MSLSDDDIDRVSDRVIGKLLAQVFDALDELGALEHVPIGAVQGVDGQLASPIGAMVESILGCIPDWFGNTRDAA